jgi:CdiI immunity protein
MTPERFPILHLLVATYFHQDWREEADSPEGVHQVFFSAEPIEFVRLLVTELFEVLDFSMNETKLRNIVLDDFGSYYDPKLENKTVRQWLSELLESAQKYLENSQSQ